MNQVGIYKKFIKPENKKKVDIKEEKSMRKPNIMPAEEEGIDEFDDDAFNIDEDLTDDFE